ncbi:MAG: biotin transporter BioY [Ignavibacteriales bacterium]|nr:biotin transporter BioY [Ignavibacteriales bacterium]
MSMITRSENIYTYIKERVVAQPLFGVFPFAILMALAAQLTIPMKPVPTTLQSMIVVLSGAMLGSKKGFYAQIAYLTMGVVGLPVFAMSPDLAPDLPDYLDQLVVICWLSRLRHI